MTLLRTLLAWTLAVALGALLAPGTLAQDPAEGENDEPIVTPVPGLEDIDDLLEGEEAVLSGRGYTYDPAGRRDPFKSLLIISEPEFAGPRPDGIPGLLIDEVVLSGIFETPQGYVAQVQAADRQKGYLIRPGDVLYDGEVVSINDNEVVFKQEISDRTALRPFREVVKALNPR